MTGAPPFAATYILPIRHLSQDGGLELADYVNWLGRFVEVMVVDGSPPGVFDYHQRQFNEAVLHIRPDDSLRCPNGKVWGVLTGLHRASHERIVIADDDVRYDLGSLREIISLLDEAELVRPQNFYDPLPWHAIWDSARILLNRATGGDWPGTLAVRRSQLEKTGGYAGDVLFENLELVRTVVAAGGREIAPLDLYVRRLPPTFRHFLSQRVRQAYDEFARPERLILQLALLPTGALLLIARKRSWLAGLAGGAIALAEFGRRRTDGAKRFPLGASFMAPFWLCERAVCSWLALASRLHIGGVRYSDGLLVKAGSSSHQLRARHTPVGVA